MCYRLPLDPLLQLHQFFTTPFSFLLMLHSWSCPISSCLNFSSVLPSNTSVCLFATHMPPFILNFASSEFFFFFFYVSGMLCYVLNSTTKLSSSNLLCQNIPVILLLHLSPISSSGSLWLQRPPSRKVQN